MNIEVNENGIIILIDNVKDKGIAQLPFESFLRVPCVGEYIAYLDKSYIVDKVIHSFKSVALLVTEVEL